MAPRGTEKQRLERTAGGARTFWEISSSDRTVEERWGDVGGKAKRRTGTFPTADAAEAEVARLVAAKRGEGFAPRAAPPPPVAIVATKRLINTELEAALAETPDDVAAWQVYGDWLVENGEAWGEVIAHATQTKNTVLHRAAAEKAWFGAGAWYELDWRRLGVVVTAELKPSVRTSAKLATGLARMFAHPAGRLVRFLTIELPDSPMAFQPVVEAIVEAAPLPLLELLTLRRRGRTRPADRVVDVGPVWAAAPRLRWLTLGWRRDTDLIDCTLGDLGAASRLETLQFQGSAGDALAIELGAAALPNLTYLELTANRTGITLASLAGILGGRGLPKLETLMFQHLDFDAGLIETFAKSPLVRRLKELWLDGGILDSAAARLLVKHADAFRHLNLVLHGNYFTDDDLALIREAIPHVDSYHQRELESPRRPAHRQEAGDPEDDAEADDADDADDDDDE